MAGGSGGVFDILADGELVFSKHQSGDFPGEDEIVRRLTARKRG